MEYGFYVHQPDLAVHLDITPARAKVVNEAVWAVIREHLYTHLSQDHKPEER